MNLVFNLDSIFSARTQRHVQSLSKLHLSPTKSTTNPSPPQMPWDKTIEFTHIWYINRTYSSTSLNLSSSVTKAATKKLRWICNNCLDLMKCKSKQCNACTALARTSGFNQFNFHSKRTRLHKLTHCANYYMYMIARPLSVSRARAHARALTCCALQEPSTS